MTTIIQIVTAIALILSIIVPFGTFFLGEKNRKRYKKSLAANCFMFFGVILVASVVMFAGTTEYRLPTPQLLTVSLPVSATSAPLL